MLDGAAQQPAQAGTTPRRPTSLDVLIITRLARLPKLTASHVSLQPLGIRRGPPFTTMAPVSQFIGCVIRTV